MRQLTAGVIAIAMIIILIAIINTGCENYNSNQSRCANKTEDFKTVEDGELKDFNASSGIRIRIIINDEDAVNINDDDIDVQSDSDSGFTSRRGGLKVRPSIHGMPGLPFGRGFKITPF